MVIIIILLYGNTIIGQSKLLSYTLPKPLAFTVASVLIVIPFGSDYKFDFLNF